MEIKETGPGSTGKGLNKHTLIMILCCLIPIAIILTLLAVGIRNSALSFAIVLLCPILMVTMMVFMHRKGDHSGGHTH